MKSICACTAIFLVVLVTAPFQNASGQRHSKNKQVQLVGMTFEGGSFGAGTIVKVDENGDSVAVLHHFDGAAGSNPYGTMIRATDGWLYGMTSQGGTSSYPHGVIFRIHTDGTNYSILHEFENATGEHAFGSLIQLADGSLAGVTIAGGVNNMGTIFKMNTDGTGYTVLHSFTGTDGYLPRGQLLESLDGKLYGMTPWGGSALMGTIYRINPDGSAFETIYNCDGIPHGNLVQSSFGTLFGMMPEGGTNGVGTIFKINPDGSGYTELFDFNNYNGRFPFGSLTIGPDQRLYGTTSAGGADFQPLVNWGSGTLFRINMDGTGHEILYNFTSADGAGPTGADVVFNKQILYGFTSSGGSTNAGVFFKFSLTENTYTKILDLSQDLGKTPGFGTVLLLNALAERPKPELTNFYIINSHDHDLAALVNGDTVRLNDFNILAAANAVTSKVRFVLDEKWHLQDNDAPFTLYANTFYNKKDILKNGMHTLTAVPYATKYGAPIVGNALTVSFVVDGSNHCDTHVWVYPNPVKGYSTINVHGKPGMNAVLGITDISNGKLKSMTSVKLDSDGNYTSRISSADFKAGFYVLTVKIGDKSIQLRLIVE